MKNQVNKKVSRVLVTLLALVVMCVACVVLSACEKECTHSDMSLSEDTATCTAGGFITHSCKDCGYSYIQATPAKGHDYDDQSARLVSATCTEAGYTALTCKVCQMEKKIEPVDALGHTVSDAVEDKKAATCEEDGYIIKTCQRCDKVLEKTVLAATGHDFTETTVAATCGEDGYTVKTCSVCGAEKVIAGEKATGEHSFVAVSVVEATCDAMGMKIERCEVCGKEQTTVMPKTEHAFGDAVNVEATCTVLQHKEKTCATCGYVEKFDYSGELAAHPYEVETELFATCAKDGQKIEKCAACGDIKTTLTPATGNHTWDNANKVVVPATCLTAGYIEVACSVCGTVAKENGDAALGHNFDLENGATLQIDVPANCLNAGYQIIKCENCEVTTTKYTDKALGHDYVQINVVEATCTAEGYTIERCALCDNEIRTEVVAPTGHTLDVKYSVAATCTTDGQTVEQCLTCQQQFVTYEKATGHKYGADPIEATAATCTEPETKTYECELCGALETQAFGEALNPNGHVWGEAEITVEATCQLTGIKTYTCTFEGCSATKEEVYAGTHTYDKAEAGEKEYVITTAVSCEEDGFTVYKCDNCEVRYTAAITKAMGHDFTSEEIIEATCYNPGFTGIAYCRRCDAAKGDITTIDKLAHKMTVKSNVEGQADLVIYMSQEGEYYSDAECTTPFEFAACNVFAIVDEVNYLFYCDECGANAGAEVIVDYTENYTENGIMTYKAVLGTVTVTSVESEEHEYATTETTEKPEGYVGEFELSVAPTCIESGKSVYYCTLCEVEYYNYNQNTEYKTVNEEAPTGHILPGVPTINGYVLNENGEYAKAEEKTEGAVNICSGESCTQSVTYDYFCISCGKSADEWEAFALNEGEDAQIYVNAASATGTLIAESERIKEGAEYYVFDSESMTSAENPRGHIWDLEKGATYEIYNVTAFKADASLKEYECKAGEEWMLVIKCAVCDALYNTAVSTEEDPIIYWSVEKLNKANAETVEIYDTITLPAHAIIEIDEENVKINVTNVFTYGYTAEGKFTTDVELIAGAKTEIVLNPNEGEPMCGAFTCELCDTEVAEQHIADKVETLVNCYTTQDCQFCGLVLINKAHLAPEYTCIPGNMSDPTQYACETCGVLMGPITAHKDLTVTVAKAATCTTGAEYALTCGCGTALTGTEDEGLVDANALKAAFAKANIKFTAELEGAVAVNAEWLKGEPNGHEWTVVATQTVDETCTTTGLYTITCANCDATANELLKTETVMLSVEVAKSLEKNADAQTAVEALEEGATEIQLVAAWLVVPALGHNWELTETVEALCESDGSYTFACSRCDASIVGEEVAVALVKEIDKAAAAIEGKADTDLVTFAEAWLTIDALGHDYTEVVTVVDATCMAAGTTTYACANKCGETETRITAEKLEHVFEFTLGKEYNCKLGYALAQFGCTNEGCVITLAELQNNKDYAPTGVLYQANAIAYLNDAGLEYAELEESFEASEHVFAHFDNLTAEHKFVAPTEDALGSAYWICATCGVREFRANSVTMEEFLNPGINNSYEAFLGDINFTVTVMYNDAVLATLTYNAEEVAYDADTMTYALTEAGYAKLAAAVAELTEGEYNAEDVAALETASFAAAGKATAEASIGYIAPETEPESGENL